MQQNIDDIVAPLIRAVPVRAIETLESDILTLVERIDAKRRSGVEPGLLAPIEFGLSEVRAVLQQLKPKERLAAFHGALKDVTERLSARRATPQVSAKPQIDAVIVTLRDIAELVSSADTLTALLDEVRGLTAKCQRIIAPGSGRRADPEPVQPAAESPPHSIEQRLKDISLRLDTLQNGSLPLAPLTPEASISDTDKSAQDALEAAHATLSQLVSRLESNLKAPRGPRIAASRFETLERLSPPDGMHHSSTTLRALAKSQDQDQDQDFPPAGRYRQPQYADLAADMEPHKRRGSIVIPIRPLIFGILVIILAATAAQVSMHLTDQLPGVLKADAVHTEGGKDAAARIEPAEPDVPDLARTQAPETFTAAPDRQAQQTALALSEHENSGVIGRPVPVAAGSREAAREPSLPLPEGLPSQLRAEAAKGKPAAEYEVGVRLVEGKSAPVNTEEGLRWLRRAAKSGIIPAHLWIGSLYEKGQGVEKDLTLARTHYSTAAEKGNAKAMHNLAVLYAEGIDGRRDYKTASRWFQRAAERGIADSQYNLAVLLMRGIGVEQSHHDAYKWFALAALQGDREAARHRDDIGGKLEPGLLAKAKTAVQSFTPQTQPNEAVVVATPPGGWDRATGETGAGRKSRSGILARGAS